MTGNPKSFRLCMVRNSKEAFIEDDLGLSFQHCTGIRFSRLSDVGPVDLNQRESSPVQSTHAVLEQFLFLAYKTRTTLSFVSFPDLFSWWKVSFPYLILYFSPPIS